MYKRIIFYVNFLETIGSLQVNITPENFILIVYYSNLRILYFIKFSIISQYILLFKLE